MNVGRIVLRFDRTQPDTAILNSLQARTASERVTYGKEFRLTSGSYLGCFATNWR